MIAVDTNVLVYAHRRDSRWHERARSEVEALARGGEAWAIPWPVVHEFIAIVTNRRAYPTDPTPLSRALEQLDAWLQSPRLALLAEPTGYWDELRQVVLESNVRGGMVHYAKIAAICLAHGVSELWTADRDFSRFPRLRTRNPLVA